ncbi:MAG: EamA family transporter [Ilumatobacteraceae bacterium]
MTTIFLAGSVPAMVALATNPPTGVDAEAIATVLYLGLAATALAYGLWSFGLGLPLRDSVTVTLLEPVSATILAVTLLDEHLGAADGIGVVAVLVGVVVATLPPRVRAPQ